MITTLVRSGAVYVFTFDSTDWTQSAYIKAFNTQTSDAFGTALAVELGWNSIPCFLL